MNYWEHLPDRDEVLEKIYKFLQLLSENDPDEAEKLVNVGSMSKFRDTLHYYLTDYSMLALEDDEMMELPDDLSVAISDPSTLDENDINPEFSGNSMVLQPNETVKLRVGMGNEITPVQLEFMIYKRENQYLLNLMKVNRP